MASSETVRKRCTSASRQQSNSEVNTFLKEFLAARLFGSRKQDKFLSEITIYIFSSSIEMI